jgi:hypothetical protein
VKFALIMDMIGSGGVKSYQVKNNLAYDLDGNPYDPEFTPAAVNRNCYISTYNYPWLYDGGYFINWEQHKSDLPDLDLDLIFLVIERTLNRQDEFSWVKIETIRKKYPNAKIVAFLKEIWVGEPYDYEHPKNKARVDFIQQCDGVIMNRPELKEFEYLSERVNKPFNFIAQPHNIDYFYDRWGGDKDLAIWAYLPCGMERRANTYEFASYISKKYNLQVRYKNLEPGQRFHFNLDPIDYFPGKQAVHVASVGSINIGGVNENHSLLYPETATCDVKILEDRIVEYLEDENKRNDVILNAWNKLNEVFSFDSVRKQIEGIKYE